MLFRSFVDVNQLPDNSVIFGGGTLPASGLNQTIQSTGQTWNAWQTYVTGYKVYSGGGLVGTYSSAAQATAVGQSLQSTSSVTIETLYASSRTGTENFTVTNTESHSLGDKVVNVDLVHYIKPQVIKIAIQGLKPYARYYTFFDKINMSAYTTPLTETEIGRAHV